MRRALGALALLVVSLASTPVWASAQSECQQTVLAESGVNPKNATAVKTGESLKYRGHPFHLARGRTIWGACNYLPDFWENAVNRSTGAVASTSSATIASLKKVLGEAQTALKETRQDLRRSQNLSLWLICGIAFAAILLIVDQILANVFDGKTIKRKRRGFSIIPVRN